MVPNSGPISEPVRYDATTQYVRLHELVWLDFLRPFLEGRLPFIEDLPAPTKPEDAEWLMADGPDVLRHARDCDGGQSVLRESGDCLVFAEQRNWTVRVTVIGPNRATVCATVEALRQRLPVDPESGGPRVSFWTSGPHGQTSLVRPIDAPPWSRIACNYPGEVGKTLAQLMALEWPVSATGRLKLWHGPPGTGKTTAIRALAEAWSSWCQLHYVADPENFFGDANYLVQVTARSACGRGRQKPRLVILEDVDDYLRAAAGSRVGGSLGRLLNVTDGLLGQGVDALMLMTTNEELGRLHPAVVRPGRCLANLEFRRFRPEEATRWLGAHPSDAGDLTLAELFCEAGRVVHLAPSNNVDRIGQYL